MHATTPSLSELLQDELPEPVCLLCNEDLEEDWDEDIYELHCDCGVCLRSVILRLQCSLEELRSVQQQLLDADYIVCPLCAANGEF